VPAFFIFSWLRSALMWPVVERSDTQVVFGAERSFVDFARVSLRSTPGYEMLIGSGGSATRI